MSDRPSVDLWLKELKSSATLSGPVGMFLVHNGVVRPTSRAGAKVSGMILAVDRRAERAAVERVQSMPGIAAVRVWINEGGLAVGDDIMVALVAGDIRDNVFAALESLVAEIKNTVVEEREMSLGTS